MDMTKQLLELCTAMGRDQSSMLRPKKSALTHICYGTKKTIKTVVITRKGKNAIRDISQVKINNQFLSYLCGYGLKTYCKHSSDGYLIMSTESYLAKRRKCWKSLLPLNLRFYFPLVWIRFLVSRQWKGRKSENWWEREMSWQESQKVLWHTVQR